MLTIVNKSVIQTVDHRPQTSDRRAKEAGDYVGRKTSRDGEENFSTG